MGRMKKGKWSKEEDKLMKDHIKKYGVGRSWQALSNTLGLQRCGRSCRSRWLNYLRPGLKHGNFTPDEERIICEMYNKRGSCWSIIAARLPGRTDLAVKNYWNSTLAKRFLPAAVRGVTAVARRRHRTAGSTSSDAASPYLALAVYDEASTTTPDQLAMVVYNEESSTTGSSPGHASVEDTAVLAAPPPAQAQVQPPLAAASNVAKEEPIAAVPVSGTVPPPGDQTGAMDIVCAQISPITLGFMEPELPWIAGFDEIDSSFLPWFDDW